MLVVDVTTSSWSALDAEARAIEEAAVQGPAAGAARRCNSSEFCAAVELFAVAFAISNRHNNLAVVAHNGAQGGYVYPPRQEGGGASEGAAQGEALRPATLRRTLAAGLDVLRGAEVEGGPTFDSRTSTLASSLVLALLYISRVRAQRPGLRARVLVLQASLDVPAQYVSIVNATYSAQRAGVVLDSVQLHASPSVFLQQAAHLTASLHLHPAPLLHASLLAYLLHAVLPDAVSRRSLQLPPPHAVNMRAHCFCCRRAVTHAWLCTVCLSVWCKPSDKCATCGSGVLAATAPEGGGTLKGVTS